MKKLFIIVVPLFGLSLTGFAQTFAGLGFGVCTGAGMYAEHFIHPNWSIEVNIGIPAAGFGMNYTIQRKMRPSSGGNASSKMHLLKRKPKSTGRLTVGLNFNTAILPDVGLFRYSFLNVGLHHMSRKTDYGMELGWMRGAIVTGPSGSSYPQPFSVPGIQFTIGHALFEPGPLKRLRQGAFAK
jgi:hypothetical protein